MPNWIDDDEAFDRVDAAFSRIEMFLLGALFGIVLTGALLVVFGG